MSLINLGGLTINTQEAELINQAVFEKTFVNPALQDAHGVRTGIQMNTQIPIFGLYPESGRVVGACTITPDTDTIPTSQKVWTPSLIEFRLPHCQGTVNQQFKLWKRSAQALGTYKDVDNEMMAFLADSAIKTIGNAIFRLSSFGDTAAALIADGGAITAGSDVTLFTPFNGIWQQIFVGVGAGDIVLVPIAENAGATYAAQGALGATVALDTMRAMYEQIDPRAFTFMNMRYEITRSLFNNWVAFLEDSSLAFTLDRTENGANRYQYRGIPIVVRSDWDRNIRAYHDNATTWQLPHRAILAPIDNIPIGTANEDAFQGFDMFYDQTLRVHYIDAAFYLDAKVLEEYAIVVAY